MPKPTLVQKLLGQPSQTYCFPSHKEYHSTKSELIRIATSPSEEELSDLRENIPRPTPSRAASLSRSYSGRSTATPPPRASTSAVQLEDYEPKRAVIHSIASYPSVHNQPNPHVNRDPPVKYLSSNPNQPPNPPPPSRSVAVRDADANSSDGDDGDTDIFYTPRSSFYSPLASPATMAAALLEPQAIASALLSPHSYSQSPESDTDSTPVSRTPSGSSISSTCSSASERDEVFSATSHATTSTRISTPVSSVRGAFKTDEEVEAITIASSPRRRPQSMHLPPSAPKPSASERANRRRSQAEVRSVTYTDADWARDVRWLAPPPNKTASPRRQPRSIPTDLVPTLQTLSSEVDATAHLKPPSPAFAAPTPRPGSRSRSKGDRSSRHSNRQSRIRMSALVEEDESEYSTGISSCEPSRASTPVHFDHRSGSSPNLGSTPSPPFSDRTRTLSSPQVQLLSPDARLADYARQQAERAHSAPDVISPLSATEPFSATLPTHTLPTPFPSSINSPLNGYTSLTLPRAGYANFKGKALGEGHVDLVRAGVAQSSMATIEVVRGAGALAAAGSTSKRNSTFSLGRTFSLSLRSKKRKESATPAHLQAAAPPPVMFTVHVAPPSFVPSSHVLIQVFAVALDGLDSLLVQDKVEAGVGMAPEKGKGRKPGFIPGRSFVGKALECGWEVKEEVCKRGEWVMGLLDVRKSGALAEFILVERHRVYRAPQPRAQNPTLFPPRRRTHTRTMSLPSGQQASAITPTPLGSSSTPQHLSLEQLALLPLCGLPAHRAVRTFTDVLAAGRAREEPDRGARVLILQGHDGPGALAAQLLRKTGARVCVQVPESAVQPKEKSSAEPKDDAEKAQEQAQNLREQLEERLLSWGAEEICVGDAVFVLERFAERGVAFDAILDTVGGVDVWEAAQKLFLLGPTPPASPALSMTSLDETARPGNKSKKSRSRAQFTTLVGDMPARAIPTAQDNLKSGFRSLRRSSTTSARTPGGARRVKRTIGYTWISVAADVDFEGEDVRDSLASVVGMVERGQMKPWVDAGEGDDEGKVLPFEKAPEAFRRDAIGPRGILKDGGTCVVKIGQ